MGASGPPWIICHPLLSAVIEECPNPVYEAAGAEVSAPTSRPVTDVTQAEAKRLAHEAERLSALPGLRAAEAEREARRISVEAQVSYG